MFSKKFTLKAVAAFTLVIAIASCSKEEVSVTSSKTQNAKPHPILLEVSFCVTLMATCIASFALIIL